MMVFHFTVEMGQETLSEMLLVSLPIPSMTFDNPCSPLPHMTINYPLLLSA